MSKLIDMCGSRYGKLLVVEKSDVRKSGQVTWKCLCDCGNIVLVRGASLRNGLTTSCGCFQRKTVTEMNHNRKRANQYSIQDDTVIGYCNDKAHSEFYFDAEFFDIVSQYYWQINNEGYIYSLSKVDGCDKVIRLHRLIMNCPDELLVDHIDHNPRNNRICNLRVCTNAENCRNIKIRKDNSTGVTGVSRSSNGDKWRARITLDGKEIHLGQFESFDSAVEARIKAELEMFGEFSPLNQSIN